MNDPKWQFKSPRPIRTRTLVDRAHYQSARVFYAYFHRYLTISGYLHVFRFLPLLLFFEIICPILALLKVFFASLLFIPWIKRFIDPSWFSSLLHPHFETFPSKQGRFIEVTGSDSSWWTVSQIWRSHPFRFMNFKIADLPNFIHALSHGGGKSIWKPGNGTYTNFHDFLQQSRRRAAHISDKSWQISNMALIPKQSSSSAFLKLHLTHFLPPFETLSSNSFEFSPSPPPSRLTSCERCGL